MTDQLLLAQQTLPPLDAMYWTLLASRVLHILGAVILFGGIFYLRMIVHRAPNPDLAASPDAALGGSRSRWAMWVGIATLLLVVTGFFNYFMFIGMYERLGRAYHMMFGFKFLLSLGVFFIAAVLAGRTAAAERFRQNMRMWLAVAIALSLAILILAAMMRTVPHIPKDAGDGPALVAPATAPAAND